MRMSLFLVDYPLDKGLDKPYQENHPDPPEERDLRGDPALQVTPEVGIVPKFHVKHLFQEEARYIFKDRGDDDSDQEKEDSTMLNPVGCDQNCGHRKTIHRVVGSKQEAPVGKVVILDGAVKCFP